MRVRFVCTPHQWNMLQGHLLSSDLEERFAVLLVGNTRIGGELVVLCHSAIPFTEPQLVDCSCGVRLSPRGVVKIMNAANGTGTGVLEVHSHPGADRSVSFSETDKAGHLEIVPFALSSLKPGRIYGSLVFGKNAFEGMVWLSPTDPVDIESVEIVGPPMFKFGTNSKAPEVPWEGARYSRQALVLGQEGQRRLSQVRVAIVGLGGIGSILARTLAYEGIRSFILIDPDRVDYSNLNRLDGGKPWDAWFRRRKVKVTRREIRRIAPLAQVEIIPGSVFQDRALKRLVTADIIFGCTDNHGSRLYLNEVSAGYLKPYIDIGSGIAVENGTITEAGGRVTIVLPGQGCLLDAHAINIRLAGHELARADLRVLAEERGYVQGADVPAPAVMSLNQTVASIAVTEFKALVTGIREPVRQVFYDLLEQKLLPGHVKRRETCLVCCDYLGKGDLLEISRRYRSLS